MNNDELLRYPAGRFIPKDVYSVEDMQYCISQLEKLPLDVEKIVNVFTTKQLDTPTVI
jgi:hypothetical protein